MSFQQIFYQFAICLSFYLDYRNNDLYQFILCTKYSQKEIIGNIQENTHVYTYVKLCKVMDVVVIPHFLKSILMYGSW